MMTSSKKQVHYQKEYEKEKKKDIWKLKIQL